MRALVVTSPGDTDALQWRHVDLPIPGPGEVRIRTVAAAVNPIDILIRSGALHQSGWIQGTVTGVGWDIAGYVDAMGADVTGLSVGTAVAGLRTVLDTPLGTHADAFVLPASDVAVIPEDLGFTEASTVPLSALTADQALDLLDLPLGASLLVTGAGGAVGGFAVALAAQRKLKVTALARAGDVAFLHATGATQVIEALSSTEGPFDGVLDAASLVEPALAVTRDGGRYVGVHEMVHTTRDIRIQAVRVEADGKRLAQLLVWAADGVLAPRIAGIVPMVEAAEAYRRVERGGYRGRWVLVS